MSSRGISGMNSAPVKLGGGGHLESSSADVRWNDGHLDENGHPQSLDYHTSLSQDRLPGNIQFN